MSSTPSQYGEFGPRPERPDGPDERGYRPPEGSQAFDGSSSPQSPSGAEPFSPQPTAYPPPPLGVPYGYAPPAGSAPPTHPVLVLGAPGNNGMGIAGFVVSLVSLIACGGVLWPISLGLSIAGMKREPKGLAIAGLVISCVSAMVFFVMFLPFFILPFIVGAAAVASMPTIAVTSEQVALDESVSLYVEQNGALPASLSALPLGDPGVLTDPWNTAYRLRPTKGGPPITYTIDSAGPDQTFGTSDDIIYHGSAPVPGGSGTPTPGAPESTPAPARESTPGAAPPQ